MYLTLSISITSTIVYFLSFGLAFYSQPVLLLLQVYDFAADGTPSVARMVLLTSRIFTVTGIVAGIAFLVIHIILFATVISSDSNE